MDSEQIPEDERVAEILRYFVEHPNAVDSLEGIANWRLGHMSSRNRMRTSEALTKLVALGLIEEISILGSGPVFRLNEANVSAAQEFLAGRNKGKF